MSHTNNNSRDGLDKYAIVYDDSVQMMWSGRVYRIIALRDIPEHNVKKGDRGGYVAGYHNLSQDGAAWVGDDAQVGHNARVTGNALVNKSAFIIGDTFIGGNALVTDSSIVTDDAVVTDHAIVRGQAWLVHHSKVFHHAIITNSTIGGYARVCGHS